MPPVIGITTRAREIIAPEGPTSAHTLQRTYSDGVLREGGISVLLAPIPRADVAALAGRLDGLILSGGGDVNTDRYDGTEHESMYGIDVERDEFEIELIRAAASRKLPVMAICRGLQIMNVALGGSLIEDIPSELGAVDHELAGDEVFNGHQHVSLDPTCLVARIVGVTDLQVNSIHHQAVRDLAPGFRAVGWADDGVVEAIEPDDETWPVIAIQWHPEYLGSTGDAASRSLFKALIDIAARNSSAA
jgi:putative glutamine amidotransferase